MIATQIEKYKINPPRSRRREQLLTGKQKKFADAWMNGAEFNGTHAARIAGYGGDENALAAAASRLLRIVKVRNYIKKELRGRLPKQKIDNLIFESKKLPPPITRDVAGANVIYKINEIRKSLSEREKEFDNYLAAAASEVKRFSSMSDSQRVGLVLACIEKAHSHSIAEIVGDTGLNETVVRQIINYLLKKDDIELRSRHTVGGSANQILIFSKRKPCSCVL
jgi:phage terminase small subunit